MNFFSNVLDAIPVVGHVKGAIHYVAGDTEGGNKAMYQATRTSAVLGGGAVGCLAGPGGAVIGAMYAGLATDGVASIAMDESQGIIKGCENIAEDIYEGKNPTGSILGTGFQLGMDAVGGLGMGGVSSAASQVSEKAVAKTVENVAKKAVATVGEKAIQKTAKVTGEEVVKMVTKTVTEKTVKKVIQTAAIQAEVALVSTHVAIQAKERTEEEKKKRDDEDNARRDRERRAREERDRQDTERRAREERDRQDTERRAREEKNRQDAERRAREEKNRQDTERRASEEKNRQDTERRARDEDDVRYGKGSGSGSGGQGNRNNDQSGQVTVNFFKVFKEMLNRLLERIFGKKKTAERTKIFNIFQKLSQGQIDYLSKIIERLMNCGILEEVLELVIKIFSEHFPRDILFQNFLSLMEFIAVYISGEISNLTVVFRMPETISTQRDSSIPTREYEELHRAILTDIMNQEDIVKRIMYEFETLRFKIERETAPPRNIVPMFRDPFSAVYHYYKHKNVPGYGILSVREYFDLIRSLLLELGKEDRYKRQLEQQKTRDVRGTVVCDMYFSLFGRRVRIVVKFQGRTSVLASCFVVEIIFDDDEEGCVIVKYYP